MKHKNCSALLGGTVASRESDHFYMNQRKAGKASKLLLLLTRAVCDSIGRDKFC